MKKNKRKELKNYAQYILEFVNQPINKFNFELKSEVGMLSSVVNTFNLYDAKPHYNTDCDAEYCVPNYEWAEEDCLMSVVISMIMGVIKYLPDMAGKNSISYRAEMRDNINYELKQMEQNLAEYKKDRNYKFYKENFFHIIFEGFRNKWLGFNEIIVSEQEIIQTPEKVIVKQAEEYHELGTQLQDYPGKIGDETWSRYCDNVYTYC